MWMGDNAGSRGRRRKHSASIISPPLTTCKGVIIFFISATLIYGILVIANLRPPIPVCPWQFPKVASCLLAAHEDLSGGLVAAATTLIIAWFGFLVVRGELDLQRLLAEASNDQKAITSIILQLTILEEMAQRLKQSPNLVKVHDSFWREFVMGALWKINEFKEQLNHPHMWGSDELYAEQKSLLDQLSRLGIAIVISEPQIALAKLTDQINIDAILDAVDGVEAKRKEAFDAAHQFRKSLTQWVDDLAEYMRESLPYPVIRRG